MVEPTKTKTHGLIENSWTRDVVIPIILIGLAILILWWVKNTSVIPDMFKPFILASGILVIAAAFLEAILILAKILNLIVATTIKYKKKLL